jgi:GNAT superfamily N-acetyltransferase
MNIEPYRSAQLPAIQDLVNLHLGAVVPGWSLPGRYIEQHFSSNPNQPIIDPWVVERRTLCAVERSRVVAVAHVLRYGAGDDIAEHYKDAGDIAWFLFIPEHGEAASLLLSAALEQMNAWSANRVFAFDSHLPVPLFIGIPDVWSHISALFTETGFLPNPDRAEALYGGTLESIPFPADTAPAADLTCVRTLRSERGTAFVAYLNGREIGWCECITDLSQGEGRPALRRWAELTEMYVQEEWRGRGIGTWLVQHAAVWMRLAGCDRVALSVAADDEAAGAGRFYRRFGWDVFTRLQDGWALGVILS